MAIFLIPCPRGGVCGTQRHMRGSSSLAQCLNEAKKSTAHRATSGQGSSPLGVAPPATPKKTLETEHSPSGVLDIVEKCAPELLTIQDLRASASEVERHFNERQCSVSDFSFGQDKEADLNALGVAECYMRYLDQEENSAPSRGEREIAQDIKAALVERRLQSAPQETEQVAQQTIQDSINKSFGSSPSRQWLVANIDTNIAFGESLEKSGLSSSTLHDLNEYELGSFVNDTLQGAVRDRVADEERSVQFAISDYLQSHNIPDVSLSDLDMVVSFRPVNGERFAGNRRPHASWSETRPTDYLAENTGGESMDTGGYANLVFIDKRSGKPHFVVPLEDDFRIRVTTGERGSSRAVIVDNDGMIAQYSYRATSERLKEF